MALDNFFSIHLPYGLKKNKKGEWMAFNREYLPLGYNLKENFNVFDDEDISSLPICTRYYRLTEKKLLELAYRDTSIRRDEKGYICMIWLYDGKSIPVENKKDWSIYLEKLRILSKLNRQEYDFFRQK